MTGNDHFQTCADWTAAAELLVFVPRRPAFTVGQCLQSLAVHVMDHRRRQVPLAARSLEAHYSGFVINQKPAGSAAEARRLALSTRYGQAAKTVQVAGHEGRSYELGVEVEPEAVDGRSPAVIVWADGPMLYLVASGTMAVASLLEIAVSMYARRQ